VSPPINNDDFFTDVYPAATLEKHAAGRTGKVSWDSDILPPVEAYDYK